MAAFPDTPSIDLVPDWVCEILSPGTRQLRPDREARPLRRARRRHLWLLDPQAGTLEAFALREGGVAADRARSRATDEVRAAAVRGDGLPALGALAVMRGRPSEARRHDPPDDRAAHVRRPRVSPSWSGSGSGRCSGWPGRPRSSPRSTPGWRRRRCAVPARPRPGARPYSGSAPRGRSSRGSSTSIPRPRRAGVGYRVIVPLALGDGRRILLDRGFVPIGEKDAARQLGPIAVEGIARLAATRPTASPARPTGRRTSGSPATCR